MPSGSLATPALPSPGPGDPWGVPLGAVTGLCVCFCELVSVCVVGLVGEKGGCASPLSTTPWSPMAWSQMRGGLTLVAGPTGTQYLWGSSAGLTQQGLFTFQVWESNMSCNFQSLLSFVALPCPRVCVCNLHRVS